MVDSKKSKEVKREGEGIAQKGNAQGKTFLQKNLLKNVQCNVQGNGRKNVEVNVQGNAQGPQYHRVTLCRCLWTHLNHKIKIRPARRRKLW